MRDLERGSRNPQLMEQTPGIIVLKPLAEREMERETEGERKKVPHVQSSGLPYLFFTLITLIKALTWDSDIAHKSVQSDSKFKFTQTLTRGYTSRVLSVP